MKYLDYISSLINDTIESVFPCERKNILGVAQSVRLDSEIAKARIVPGIYQGIGKDVLYSGFDDKWSVSSYHKAIRTTSRRSTTGGYGDNMNDVVLTHEMQLVLMANVDEIGMTADQLALVIQMVFPDALRSTALPAGGFKAITFNVNSVTLNTEQVFREEFQNVDYFLGPEHVLVKVAYTVESILDKKCFNPCYAKTSPSTI